MQPEEAYKQYRSLLFGLAYRLLGSAADAEDIVQDVFAAYMQVDAAAIGYPKAYLAKMTANRCFNLLQLSRRKREQYVGPWLPEPLATKATPAADGPERMLEQKENIGYAFLVLLQQLTPPERAVYVLRETLGFEYRDIAEIMERSEAGCRKLYSRARQKASGAAMPAAQPMNEAQRQFAESFLRASDTGDFKPLLAYLMEDVELVSDGGGKARAAIRPIAGVARVLAFFAGIHAKGSLAGLLRTAELNGETALLLIRDGRTVKALCAEWEPSGARIRRLYLIVNPEKLALLDRALGK